MDIRTICANPACGKAYRLSETYLGKRVVCKRCGQEFVVTPAAAETHPPAVSTTGGGQPVAGPPGEPPQRLGRFLISATLGAGAFGTVYRACDPVLGREVALKVPHPGRIQTEADRARFLREAKLAAQLRHPNIVPVYDAGEDSGRSFIAAAFIEGQTLQARLAEGMLTADQAVSIVLDLAQALDYAHRQGVVHRDVKPGNIMLDAQGTPLLMDFGLARAQEGEEKLTQEGLVVGTPAYMSPEQAQGRHDAVGPASDQYSLGVVLYELLCGETPFSGPPAIVIYNVLHQDPRPPRQVKATIPRDLETIVLKALARKPSDRYASCWSLAADLRRWRDGEPIRARKIGAVERFGRWCRRNPVVAGLAGAIFLAVTSGASISAYFAFVARERAEQAEDNRRLAVANEKLARKNANKAEAAQQKEAVARLAAQAADNEERLARKSAEHAQQGEKAARLAAERRSAEACLERGRSLCEQNRVGAGMLWMVRALEVSPKDDHLWQHAIRANLAMWHQRLHRRRPFRDPQLVQQYLSKDEPERETRAKLVCPVLSSAAFSPDSSLLAVGVAGRVRFYDPRTLTPSGEDLPHDDNVVLVRFSADGQRLLTLENPQRPVAPNVNNGLLGDPNIVSRARLWNVTTRKLEAGPLEKMGFVSGTVTPDGQKSLLGVVDKRRSSVTFWDVASGEQAGEPANAQYFALSPNGKHFATGYGGSIPAIWELHPRRQVAKLPAELAYNRIEYSPDGKYLVVASGFDLIILDGADGAILRRISYTDNMSLASGFEIASDGSLIASGGGSTVYLWDQRSGEAGPSLHHSGFSRILAVAPKGQYVLSADLGGIWLSCVSEFGNLNKNGVVASHTLFHYGPMIHEQVGSPEANRIPQTGGDRLIAGRDLKYGLRIQAGRAQLWDNIAGKALAGVLPTEALIRSWLTPDGAYCVTIDKTRTLRVWNIPSLRPVGAGMNWEAVLPEEGSRYDWPTAITLHHTERLLAVGAGEYACVFSVDTGEFVGRRLEHRPCINTMAFHPNGRILATGSLGDNVRLWDVETGTAIGWPLRTGGQVRQVGFSEDGHHLGVDNSLTIYSWPMHPAVDADPATVRLAVEISTGLTIGESGREMVLDSSAWQKRCSALGTPVFDDRLPD